MARNQKSRERERAFQALYGLSFSPAKDAAQLERAFLVSPSQDGGEQAPEGFAWDLVKGVWENEAALDEQIRRFSRNWRKERIGRIELILLRLALYEMIYIRSAPKLCISESIDLAKQFGAGGATSFINGILDAAARQTRPDADMMEKRANRPGREAQ